MKGSTKTIEKQTKREVAKRERLKCLLITPFDSSTKPLRNTIARALRDFSIDVVALEDTSMRGRTITEAVTNLIEDVDFIIADVSRMNPNVIFELGYALGRRKSILLIKDRKSEAKMPANLMGRLYIQYDSKNFSQFVHNLVQIVPNYIIPHTLINNK